MTPGRIASWLQRVLGRDRQSHLRSRALIADLADAGSEGSFLRLRALLHPHVELVIDADGTVPAPLAPVRGRDAVARALAHLFSDDPGVRATDETVNGLPGLALRRGDAVIGVIAVDVRAGAVTAVWAVLNPDKLRHWNLP